MLVLLGAAPLVPVKHSGEKASIGVAGGPALPSLKIVGPLIQKGAPALPGDDENVVDDMSVIHGLLYEMVTAVELGVCLVKPLMVPHLRWKSVIIEQGNVLKVFSNITF